MTALDTATSVLVRSSVLLSVCWPSIALGDCQRYSVEIIRTGCTVGGLVIGRAINQDGVISGSRYAGCLGNRKPIIREPGGPIVTIQLPSQSPDGDAFGINAIGDVVGYMEGDTAGGARIPFLLHNGVVELLPSLPGGSFGVAYAINDAGVAVGYDSAPFPTAVRWSNGVPEVIKLGMGMSSTARDINTAGEVCGYWSSTGFDRRAFLWRNGRTTDIGIYPGYLSGQATALNDVGQVAGRGPIPNPVPGGNPFVQRSWIWQNGEFTLLCETGECTESYVYDMNDAGQVVGFVYGPAFANAINVGIASIWQNGEMRLLGELTDLPPGIRLNIAYGINNAGQITGEALGPTDGQLSAFILTPIPALTGDTNCDWVVNIDDLTAVILSWGEEVEGQPFSGSADVNEDGVVDEGDLVEVINGWTAESEK